jgi:hypothetical protein
MVVRGMAIITGTMSTFPFWLLSNFPIFTKIG